MPMTPAEPMTPAQLLREMTFDAKEFAASDDKPITAMQDTVQQASGALDELQDLFTRMKGLFVLAREQHRNEEKIGELFVRAQDYVNEALADAEQRARQLIADAECEAAHIINDAREEAQRIVHDARPSLGLPPEAIQNLQSTIDGFAQLNRELLGELTSIGETLSGFAPAALPPPLAPSALPPPPRGEHVPLPPPPFGAPVPTVARPNSATAPAAEGRASASEAPRQETVATTVTG